MEHAYSRPLVAPAEQENATNAQLTELVRRDFGVTIGTGTWASMSQSEKNRFGVMETDRTGEPTTRWQTVRSETPSVVDMPGIKRYRIDQSWSEPAIETSRETARADVQAWLSRWESSEFTHNAVVYAINAEQERRLSVTNGQARIAGDGFTASWYAKDGTKMDFPSRAAWDGFYQTFHSHLEAGNSAAETAMQAIDAAQTTAALDAALAALPAPAGVSARATGPFPGGQADQGKTEPVVRR